MCPFLRNRNKELRPQEPAQHILQSCLHSFPFLGAERKPSPPPAGVPAHCKQEGSWLLLHVFYLQLQRQMNITTSSKPGHSQVGAFEIPLLTHWGTELRIFPLDHPNPPAVIAEHESDFSYLVLKPPLKDGGTQGKKPRCNRHESNTLLLCL